MGEACRSIRWVVELPTCGRLVALEQINPVDRRGGEFRPRVTIDLLYEKRRLLASRLEVLRGDDLAEKRLVELADAFPDQPPHLPHADIDRVDVGLKADGSHLPAATIP